MSIEAAGRSDELSAYNIQLRSVDTLIRCGWKSQTFLDGRDAILRLRESAPRERGFLLEKIDVLSDFCVLSVREGHLPTPLVLANGEPFVFLKDPGERIVSTSAVTDVWSHDGSFIIQTSNGSYYRLRRNPDVQ